MIDFAVSRLGTCPVARRAHHSFTLRPDAMTVHGEHPRSIRQNTAGFQVGQSSRMTGAGPANESGQGPAGRCPPAPRIHHQPHAPPAPAVGCVWYAACSIQNSQHRAARLARKSGPIAPECGVWATACGEIATAPSRPAPDRTRLRTILLTLFQILFILGDEISSWGESAILIQQARRRDRP
jgi:hypothetical protein